VAAWQDFLSEL
jgi:hypothetical protein